MASSARKRIQTLQILSRTICGGLMVPQGGWTLSLTQKRVMLMSYSLIRMDIFREQTSSGETSLFSKYGRGDSDSPFFPSHPNHIHECCFLCILLTWRMALSHLIRNSVAEIAFLPLLLIPAPRADITN